MERVSHGAALVAVVAASLLLAFAPRPPAPERVKPKEQEFVVALQAPPPAGQDAAAQTGPA